MFSDMDEVYVKLGELEILMKRSKDILDSRIEDVLEDMSMTPLCTLPEDDPITVESFMHLTEETCATACKILTK